MHNRKTLHHGTSAVSCRVMSQQAHQAWKATARSLKEFGESRQITLCSRPSEMFRCTPLSKQVPSYVLFVGFDDFVPCFLASSPPSFGFQRRVLCLPSNARYQLSKCICAALLRSVPRMIRLSFRCVVGFDIQDKQNKSAFVLNRYSIFQYPLFQDGWYVPLSSPLSSAPLSMSHSMPPGATGQRGAHR